MKSMELVLCHLHPSACVRYCVQSKGQNAFSCCLHSQLSFYVPLSILQILSYFFFCFYWQVPNTKPTCVFAFSAGPKVFIFSLNFFLCKTHKTHPIQFISQFFRHYFIILFIYHWSTEEINHKRFTLQLV